MGSSMTNPQTFKKRNSEKHYQQYLRKYKTQKSDTKIKLRGMSEYGTFKKIQISDKNIMSRQEENCYSHKGDKPFNEKQFKDHIQIQLTKEETNKFKSENSKEKTNQIEKTEPNLEKYTQTHNLPAQANITKIKSNQFAQLKPQETVYNNESRHNSVKKIIINDKTYNIDMQKMKNRREKSKLRYNQSFVSNVKQLKKIKGQCHLPQFNNQNTVNGISQLQLQSHMNSIVVLHQNDESQNKHIQYRSQKKEKNQQNKLKSGSSKKMYYMSAGKDEYYINDKQTFQKQQNYIVHFQKKETSKRDNRNNSQTSKQEQSRQVSKVKSEGVMKRLKKIQEQWQTTQNNYQGYHQSQYPPQKQTALQNSSKGEISKKKSHKTIVPPQHYLISSKKVDFDDYGIEVPKSQQIRTEKSANNNVQNSFHKLGQGLNGSQKKLNHDLKNLRQMKQVEDLPVRTVLKFNDTVKSSRQRLEHSKRNNEERVIYGQSKKLINSKDLRNSNTKKTNKLMDNLKGNG